MGKKVLAWFIIVMSALFMVAAIKLLLEPDYLAFGIGASISILLFYWGLKILIREKEKEDKENY